MKIYINKNSIKFLDLFIVIFDFLYLFRPCLSRVSTLVLLDVVLVPANLIYIIQNKKLQMYKNEVNTYLSILPFIVYFYTMMAIRLFTSVNHFSVIFAEIISSTIVIFRIILIIGWHKILIKNFHYTIQNIIDFYIAAAFIQFIFVIASFVNPTIRNFFNGLTLKYGTNEFVELGLLNHTYRGYGFSSNLYDSFGYICALLITLTFIKGISKQKTDIIILSILFFFMPLVNTRTGVLLGIVGIMLTLIYYRKFDTNMLRIVLALIVSIFVIVKIAQMILPKSTLTWAYKGFYDTRQLIFNNEKIGVYDSMFGRNLYFPDNLFFGEGADPYNLVNYGIESGYVQLLWRFGIFGSILLIVGLIRIFLKTLLGTDNKQYKIILISFMIIYFIYYMKLFALHNMGGNYLIFGIISMILFDSNTTVEADNGMKSLDSSLE